MKIGSGITTLEANWDLHCVKELTCASDCTQTGTTCKCTTSKWVELGHADSLSHCKSKGGSRWTEGNHNCYKSETTTTTSTLSCPTDIESTLNGTTCHAGIKDNVCASGWTQSIE